MIKKLYIKHKEVINYLIVGILTTFVSLSCYYLLVLTILDPANALELQTANILSWVAAVTFAYFTNRTFVFESTNRSRLSEAGRFYASRVITLLVDMFIMYLFVTKIGVNDKVAKVIVQVVITALNYVMSKFLVFARRKKNEV